MKGPARLLIVLALPLVVGKLLEFLLGSTPGKKLVEKSGYGEFSTDEGIDMAKKYAAAGAGAVGAAATALTAKAGISPTPYGPDPKTLTWSAIAVDTAELLLATGAMVKVVGEFLKDREALRLRKLGGHIRS